MSRFGLLILTAALSSGGAGFQPCLAASDSPAKGRREVGPELRVRKQDGFEMSSRFLRGSATLTDNARLTPRETLVFDNRPFQPKSCLPVRIVTLWTGEVFPAWCSLPERQTGTPSSFSAQLFAASPLAKSSKSSIALNVSDVSSIRQPLGTFDVCPTDSRLSPAGSWQKVDRDHDSVSGFVDALNERSWQRRVLQVPRFEEESHDHDCLVVLCGRWPKALSGVKHLSPDDEIRSGGTLKFHFVDRQGVQRRIDVSGRGERRLIQHPDGREETVAVGTERLQLQLRAGREVTLSSNDVVLAKIPTPIGQLTSIEVEGPLSSAIRNASKEANSLFLTEPLVRFADRKSDDSSNIRTSFANAAWKVATLDRVVLNSGNEIFGVIDEADSAVGIRSAGNSDHRLLVERKDVSAIGFGRPESSVGQPVTGEFVQIDLVPDASCSMREPEEPFWLRSAIKYATDDGLLTQHPLLGEVTVRWKMIRRIRPLFAGSYSLLDAGPRHLGNGYRESFSRIEPDGTELSFSFKITTEQLAQPTFLSADIAELIPSGPGTLKATPFLDEVRAGFLATQVFVNGERAGSLNELITLRAPATCPERARMLLPKRLLKAGQNTIEIRQTSAKDDATSFDDCELRAIAIEVEQISQR